MFLNLYDEVFFAPLPVSLNELKQRITTGVASVDRIYSGLFGQNIDCRIDICRVTNGLYMEHL
jgi:hypothetical protein